MAILRKELNFFDIKLVSMQSWVYVIVACGDMCILDIVMLGNSMGM